MLSSSSTTFSIQILRLIQNNFACMYFACGPYKSIKKIDDLIGLSNMCIRMTISSFESLMI